MKLQDLGFYNDSSPQLEGLTVITNAPQTNPRWVINDFAKRYNARLIELGVERPPIAIQEPKDLVIVTNIELPVLSGIVQADEMVQYIAKLRESNTNLVVSITLSDELTDRYYDTGRQLARLAVRLLYQAQLVIQLRPLETGRARDITGRFTVAKGPQTNLSSRDVVERELFYFVGPRFVELTLRS